MVAGRNAGEDMLAGKIKIASHGLKQGGDSWGDFQKKRRPSPSRAKASEFDMRMGGGRNKGPIPLPNQREVYLVLKGAKALPVPCPLRPVSASVRNKQEIL